MRLFSRESRQRFDSSNQSSGSEPTRSLSEQSNDFKLVMNPNEDGKVPVSWLPSKERRSKAESLQNEFGIGPDRLLS